MFGRGTSQVFDALYPSVSGRREVCRGAGLLCFGVEFGQIFPDDGSCKVGREWVGHCRESGVWVAASAKAQLLARQLLDNVQSTR